MREWMYLTICSLHDPGPIPDHGKVFRGFFPGWSHSASPPWISMAEMCSISPQWCHTTCGHQGGKLKGKLEYRLYGSHHWPSWKQVIDLVLPKQDGFILWLNPPPWSRNSRAKLHQKAASSIYPASVKIALDDIQKFYFIWIIYRRPKGFFDIHRSTDMIFYSQTKISDGNRVQ